HRWWAEGYHPPEASRLEGRWQSARVDEDGAVVVFDRALLPAPTRPILVPLDGWRPVRGDRSARGLADEARLAAYNPAPHLEMVLALDAGPARPRGVRLLSRGRELARGRTGEGPSPRNVTLPFVLRGSHTELTLRVEPTAAGEPLWINALRLEDP